MKRLMLLFVAIFCTINMAQAQTSPVTNQLKASIQNGNLHIDWMMEEGADNTGYWEVQGSMDAKNFKTLGMLWGQNPQGEKGQYNFKQNSSKLAKQYTHYRVLMVKNSSEAIASKTVELSK